MKKYVGGVFVKVRYSKLQERIVSLLCSFQNGVPNEIIQLKITQKVLIVQKNYQTMLKLKYKNKSNDTNIAKIK